MSLKTVILCFGVLILATTRENDEHSPELKLHLHASKLSEIQYENKPNFDVSFPRFTGECRRISWKALIQSFEAGKQNYGICTAQVDFKKQVDLTIRHTKNNQQLLKVLWIDNETTNLTNKVLATSWLVVFTGNNCTLILYIVQLATSGTRERFLRNLAIVHILLTTAQSLLLLLTALKPEWEAGEARFTTVEFTTTYLAFASMFAITAMAYALHRLN